MKILYGKEKVARVDAAIVHRRGKLLGARGMLEMDARKCAGTHGIMLRSPCRRKCHAKWNAAPAEAREMPRGCVGVP